MMMKCLHPVAAPLITISVENIDDAMKNVKKIGREMVSEKIQAGDMGYAAYFKDSEGNIIGLWENHYEIKTQQASITIPK